uniref:TOX high mobility group box family member 3-like isoform X2 n=1 Tax=Myxine glutinosa TaxID=7769 RepID=UPI00358ECE17
MGAVRPGRDGHDHRRLPAGGRPLVWRGLGERRLNRRDTEKEASSTSGSAFRSAKTKQQGSRTGESRAASSRLEERRREERHGTFVAKFERTFPVCERPSEPGGISRRRHVNAGSSGGNKERRLGSAMDLRFYSPAAAACYPPDGNPSLDPSRCVPTAGYLYPSGKFGGESYMSMMEPSQNLIPNTEFPAPCEAVAVHPHPDISSPSGSCSTSREFLDPVLFRIKTFHTPSLGDEEFEIPPINPHHEIGPTSLPMNEHIVRYPTVEDTLSHQRGQFAPQFPPQNLDLPAITISRGMVEAMGPPMGILAMSQASGPCFGREAAMGFPRMLPVTSMAQRTLLDHHGPLSTINQSHLGLAARTVSVTYGSPSPPGSKSATPSPTSSANDEEGDDTSRGGGGGGGGGEKRPAPDSVKKPKTPKKKKKKDPNEPQKPVSAYALFFRDTQAAIKGQNPNATFGEVSKIVASMWDGLAEEQKQAYKRRTEAAKKEYLKALAAYRASLVSKSYPEPGDNQSPRLTLGGIPQPGMSPPFTMPAAPMSQSSASLASHLPLGPRSMAPKLSGPVSTMALALAQPSHQISPPRGISAQLMSQGMAMTQAPPHPMSLQHLHSSQPMALQQLHGQPIMSQQELVQQSHQSLQGGPHHQTQPMMVFSRQMLGSPIPSPHGFSPALSTQQGMRCEGLGPEQMPQPMGTSVQSSFSSTPDGSAVLGSPGPAPAVPSPQGRPCVHAGCTNPSAPGNEWENEYCNSECDVSHCRDSFVTWVAGRSQGSTAPVK